MGRGLAFCTLVAGVLAVALAAASGPSPAIRAVVVAGHSVPGGGRFASFTVESLPVLAPVNGKDHGVFFRTLYVFVVMHHETRQILRVRATRSVAQRDPGRKARAAGSVVGLRPGLRQSRSASWASPAAPGAAVSSEYRR
jgi:hypothetical protein